jgi:adenine-specific DNA-methyltransferase
MPYCGRQTGKVHQDIFAFASGLASEYDLAAASLALGARRISGWSGEETRLTRNCGSPGSTAVAGLRRQIRVREDPLGEAFGRLRPPEVRRQFGATYTPDAIVDAMVGWAKSRGAPVRIVDPGVGSGRFLVAAGRQFPQAELVGIEVDPLAALLARAHLAAAGFAERSEVRLQDYRSVTLAPVKGKTLFLGNPPYVRHHLVEASWKQWLSKRAAGIGYVASQLSGLHIHFFLATALLAVPGDYGCFITAAEWMDVNYGRLVRDLFLGALGGQGITVIEPTAQPFIDAASTAAISLFEVGSKPSSVFVRRVNTVAAITPLESGRLVSRNRLASEARWSHLTRRAREVPAGYVELGELCRVHRGQVTGANRIWIAGDHSRGLPDRVLFASVTKARELFGAGTALTDETPLRRVIDLPIDLDLLKGAERKAVEQFLTFAKTAGAHHGYVAENRKVWWSVGLRAPAPILATYMARRPPAFVHNLAAARHINIAHGLYPREPLEPELLDRLAKYLSSATRVEQGRTYAGGLTKFEPREMERLLVPAPELLRQRIPDA